MNEESARAYVKGWMAAGAALDEQHWLELASLTTEHAAMATDALIRAALLVPLSAERRTSSGLVAQQAAFHRRRL